MFYQLNRRSRNHLTLLAMKFNFLEQYYFHSALNFYFELNLKIHFFYLIPITIIIVFTAFININFIIFILNQLITPLSRSKDQVK